MRDRGAARSEFLDISPWIAPPPDLQPALEGDRRTDVAIIGGGYTGLCTALALKARGVAATILESGFAGFGASGRNAGHLTPTISKDLPTLFMLFGKQRATELVRFAEAGVGEVERLIRAHGIACDYEPAGNVMAAVHPAHARRLRRAAEIAVQIGAHVEFLDAAAMRARTLPPAFLAGLFEATGGTLDPGKYVTGLRRAALAAGVTIHEATRVEAIADGAPVRVRTAGGTVTADAVVLATNAYTPALGWLRRTVVPLYDTLFETAPLSDAQWAAIGWGGREGIYTAHESLESYRSTARGTVVGGSKGVRYAFGSRLVGGPNASTLRLIERGFRDRFPQLHEVEIARFWGGWIAMTLHTLPVLGRTGARNNIHYALGYNGHGVATASLMGTLLADALTDRPNEHAAALRGWAPRVPPEPLRWLVVRGLLGAVNAIDARIDRQVRAGARVG
jgi:gamma-glutamylputrescine oxidase